MKYSIKKIFNNLSMFLIIITLTVGMVTLLVIEQNSSYTKINNLKNQKTIITSLLNLQNDDIELPLIYFNAKSSELHHQIKKLSNLNKYDYVSKFILRNSHEYLSDLEKLSKLTTAFNKSVHKQYLQGTKNEDNEELKKSFNHINIFLNSMIFKDISYGEEKFNMLEKISIITFILTLLIAFWYRRRLNSIYNDILHLHAIDKDKGHKNFSLEADAIQLRIGKKHITTDNSALLDTVTQINNYDGMINSYNNKKMNKEHKFTSVTIFEIDNFSKEESQFTKEFTQNIIKKIAFTISLHKKANDIIARTNYNQFTVILSRNSKEQSFKDVDFIRQSIAELKLNTPNEAAQKITVSGGFIIKSNNQNLDESLNKAKEILLHAQKNSKNSISQTIDLAINEL